MEHEVEILVARVMARLAPLLGADGRRGKLAVVLCGATACFSQAVQQVRALLLDGYRMDCVFSPAGEELHGNVFRKQMAGFSHVDFTAQQGWFGALKDAMAVLVPLLSVNTLSKVSMLMADNGATNCILHALFMGTPVVAARNGADPLDASRSRLGFDRGTPALRQELVRRFQAMERFGCVITDVTQLRNRLNTSLKSPTQRAIEGREPLGSRETVPGKNPWESQDAQTRVIQVGRVLTAADILRARHSGADLRLSPDTVVTPLALETAWRCGVRMEKTTSAIHSLE